MKKKITYTQHPATKSAKRRLRSWVSNPLKQMCAPRLRNHVKTARKFVSLKTLKTLKLFICKDYMCIDIFYLQY